MNIDRFEQHLAQLRQQANDLDKRRGDADKPLFDEHLFSGYPKRVSPCVEQAQQQLLLIEKCLAAPTPNPERLGYLCDHLALQIHALQRELVTVSIRANEPKAAKRFYKSISTLYQELSQHIEWERRLLQMCHEKTQEIERTSVHNTTFLQREQVALEARLERCRTAKVKIEKQIQYQERYE